jgi:hypothetical protein
VFLINVPVVLIAVTAVILLMPESRSTHRPRVDVTGVLISSAGLAGLTYGLIKAGQNGWSNPTAVATMTAGVVVLAAFVAWERMVSRRQAGQPLVDLTLFRSAGFTWGTLLSAIVQLALVGIIFAMPQYFLDVRGLNSLGAGVRLLPMIGGLAVGLMVGQRLQSPRKARGAPPGSTPDGAPAVNSKVLVAGGFAIMAAALAVGTRTTVASGTGFTAAWIAVTGLGFGFAMPTALNAALGALSPERSGSGSALMTAMRQVGATIGVAVLGTVLASVYSSHVQLGHLPAAAADTARGSVAGGVAVARAGGSAPLLHAVRTAYVQGMDVMLWACVGIAAVAALLALAFMPRRAGGAAADALAADAKDAGQAPEASVPAAAGDPARAE